MSDVILETRNISKKYKDKFALENVSVTLKKNHIKTDFRIIEDEKDYIDSHFGLLDSRDGSPESERRSFH